MDTLTPEQQWYVAVREEAEVIVMCKGWAYKDALAEAKRRIPKP